MNTQLIWITPDAEKHIAYCARVSSPNQENSEYEKLLRYCYKNGHWSIFEMANMCIEIKTTRAISPQILRHRSFSFQEFSQRYAEVSSDINEAFESITPRAQDYKNRQNSLDTLSDDTKQWFKETLEHIETISLDAYNKAISDGIAKESARFLLPTSTKSKLYMNGTIRSWIHYIKVRSDAATQLEHRQLADDILENIVREHLPTIYKIIKDE